MLSLMKLIFSYPTTPNRLLSLLNGMVRVNTFVNTSFGVYTRTGVFKRCASTNYEVLNFRNFRF